MREGKPKPSQVIINQNSQMKIRYICLYPLSRKINTRQKLGAGIYVPLKIFVGTRAGLVCVGDLETEWPGVSSAPLTL